MKITRNNYEVYFIDYIDGSLSQNEVDMLLLFLEENPDLAAEIDGLNEISLEKINVNFEQKESLKKTFGGNGVATEFDYLCIAEYEGDITADESARLDKLIVDLPSRKTERDLHQKTRLKPPTEIVYQHKSKIKRTLVVNLRQTTFRNAISVAAGLVILFGLFTVFNSVNTTEKLLVPSSVKPIVSNKSEISKEVGNESATSTQSTQITAAEVVKSKGLHDKEVVNQSVVELDLFPPSQHAEHVSPLKTIAFKSFETNSEKIALLEIPLNNTPRTKLPVENTDNQPPTSNKGSSRTLDIFDIVQVGVQKLADATGSSIQLSAEKDQSGRLKKINFDSKLFALSTPVRKK